MGTFGKENHDQMRTEYETVEKQNRQKNFDDLLIADGDDQDVLKETTNSGGNDSEELEESKKKAQSMAAVKIQALVRGIIVRNSVREEIQEYSAIVIQALVRGVLVRDEIRNVIEGYAIEDDSATIIQSRVRGMLVREAMRNEIREECSILIQSHVRGMLLREKLRNESFELDSEIRELSCILIQTIVRRFLAKLKTIELKQEKLDEALHQTSIIEEFQLQHDSFEEKPSFEPSFELCYSVSTPVKILASSSQTAVSTPTTVASLEAPESAPVSEKKKKRGIFKRAWRKISKRKMLSKSKSKNQYRAPLLEA